MSELDDHELIAEFARNKSETAFATLTARYVNLVYSSALRFTGNPHHAEEITQAVFIILAHKAGGLRRGTVLSGWLYQTARLTAANFVKGEIRRQKREQEAYVQSTLNEPNAAAWEQIAPLLDEAMGRLGETDRNAVVLRFFENKTAQEVGAKLKLNEAAAHKRVSRALEKLRKFFTKRGVTLSAAAIAGAVAANSVQAAPVGLAITVAATAAKGSAVAASTLTLIKGALKVMAWTKAKTVIVASAIVLLAAGTTTVIIERAVSSANMAVFEELFKRPFNDPATVKKLENAPPVLILRPAKDPNGGFGFRAPDGKCIFVNASVRALMRFAYGFSSTARIVFPANLPSGGYDYLNTLPKDQRIALREELKKQFGMAAHSETRETDVLLLKVKDSAKLKSHMAKNQQSPETGAFRLSPGIANDEMTGFEMTGPVQLAEAMRQIPIIDQTGSTNFYTFDETQPPPHTLNELGLELVPSRAPIEMLVVEKVK